MIHPFLKTFSPVLLLLACLLTDMQNVFAQKGTDLPLFHFEIIELPNYQHGNHVQTIVQDSFGLMWFGSQHGLTRWDGYQFKTYVHNPDDPTSIGGNYVEHLHVAKDGTLWIGLYEGGGLSRFDYETETFHAYLIAPGTPKNGRNTINEITEDANGHLWLTSIYGLHRFNTCTETFKTYLHNPHNPHSLSANHSRSLLIDASGTLWVGTGFPWDKSPHGGLNRYRPETDDFVRYLHNPDDAHSLSNNKVSALFEDSKGRFWVGTSGDGLHLMDRESGSFQRLQNHLLYPDSLNAPFINELSDRHVRFIFEDHNHNIWIGSWQGGLKFYDPETGSLQTYYPKANSLQNIPEPFLWQMFQSKDGTRWASTAGGTARVFKVKETLFDFYPLDVVVEAGRYGFWESQDQQIIISPGGNNRILQFDRRTQQQTWIDLNLNVSSVNGLNQQNMDTPILDSANPLEGIWSMVADNSDRIWANKSGSEALFSIHPASGDVSIYQHDPSHSQSISQGKISQPFKDKQGNIWVATRSGTLHLYHPKQAGFSHYSFGPTDIDCHSTYLITQTPDDYIWLSSVNKQKQLDFIRFDPATETFTWIDYQIKAEHDKITVGSINDLQSDAQGNLWMIGDDQLIKLDAQRRELTSINTLTLGAAGTGRMIIDKQNRIWIFENNIILYDPDSGNYTRFDANDGVKYNPHLGRSLFQDSNGIIYFSSKGGFQRFDPQKVGKVFSTYAQTLISDFQLLYQRNKENEHCNFPFNPLGAAEISLKHNQNDFSLHFATLNFQSPHRNQQQFKLEGFDEEWRTAGVEHKVSYIDVPPGEFLFRVRSGQPGTEWSTEKTLRIHISPPFWATWWAYMFYVLGGMALLIQFYQFQVKRKLDQAEAFRLKELDAIKSRLYTNITHEFRTPLTVIYGMTEQIRSNPSVWLDEGLHMIQRNSNRLLDLVNQLLDLSKLESGKIALHVQQGDIIAYLKYLVESVHSFAESRQVRVHFYAEEETCFMDYDVEKVQQVMTNLLSNAVKFTPPDGDVYVTIRHIPLADHRPLQQVPMLQIRIRDTGMGIPAEDLPFIFDRFYQVNDSATRQGEGSGIGLALVRELIKLMDGEISVNSKWGEETTFTIHLPIRNAAPERPMPFWSETLPLSTLTASVSTKALANSPGEKTSVQGNGSKARVLLIEDNPDVVAYIVSCLQDTYEILVGKDGQEGIDIAIDSIPDLILTDVMMPFKDGFEVCQTLKSHPLSSHIPIIMLTAKADMDSKLEGLAQGADAYLAKPFHKEELLIRMSKLLALRQQLQAYYLSLAGLTASHIPLDAHEAIAAPENQFVQKLREVVEAHLDDIHFTVEKFCLEIGMSRSQLHRKLTALTGLSPNKFIRDIRLSKAKVLLQDPDMNISLVAYQTGFNDPGYFGRLFKKEFGMTPLQWRAAKSNHNPQSQS